MGLSYFVTRMLQVMTAGTGAAAVEEYKRGLEQNKMVGAAPPAGTAAAEI